MMMTTTTTTTPHNTTNNNGNNNDDDDDTNIKQTDKKHDGRHLFPGDGHVVGDVGEDGGLDEVALVALATAACLQLGTLLLALLYQTEDLVELLLVNLYTHRWFTLSLFSSSSSQ